jgi:PilZ domain
MNLAPNTRRFHRRPCSLPIELRRLWTPYPFRSTTVDLSAAGCYVNLTSILPVGTAVDVALWIGETKLAFRGTVRSADGVGNGIDFTGMNDEQRSRLRHYVDGTKGAPTLPTVIFR